MRPMLASPADRPPPGPGWSHEVKWDGMRVLADVREGRVRLTSRTENDVTASFPELDGLAAACPDALLDGEVVAFEDRRPSFAALADRMHVGDRNRALRLVAVRPVTFVVFDLLRLYGVDVTARPLAERRATLERLDLADAHWQVPPTYTDGALLAHATLDQGLEGVVSKRLSSRYLPGRRSEDWLKIAHRLSRSVVVGGWRSEVNSGRGLERVGAVLVGTPTAHGLRYLGRVGSGISGREQQRLAGVLSSLASSDPPFAEPGPRVDADGAAWVRPEVIVEVRSLGGTSGGRLRQPSYHGIRTDLALSDLPQEP